jgi:hypothetical protein
MSGRMLRGCGFWYGMRSGSAIVCASGLFNVFSLTD